MIFFDTSAAVALADVEDLHHARAIRAMEEIERDGLPLHTHNYVLVESAAVLQRRFGLTSALSFLAESRTFTVHWITPEDHAEAVELLERRGKRNLSLVDCMSFIVMRQYGITTALVYDSDFQAEGFDAWR